MKKFKHTGGDSFENFKESYKNVENCTDEEINKVKNIISSIREETLSSDTEGVKQETLEEAAEKFVEQWFENGNRTTEVFNAGAKWQQEKMYSDEDFKVMVYNMVGQLAYANNMTFNGAILDELFNKFKNQ